ncbi:MAG: hypothetical protein ISR80_05505 [Nitrosopumilus sp.]|nr:hypothetical protein [Nitrosopumilus sp.]
MKLVTTIFGVLLLLFGLAVLGISIFSPNDTPLVTALGIILVAIAIGLLVFSKILEDREKKNCNCCKCSNCSLEHEHWSH